MCVCIHLYHLQQTLWAAIWTQSALGLLRRSAMGYLSLWYAQIRALGPLFKHLGPGVLKRPPHPFATKGEEMEEWALAATAAEGNVCYKKWTHECVRVQRLMLGWLFPPPPPSTQILYPSIIKKIMSQNREEGIHWLIWFIPLKKNVLWKDRVKALMVISNV